MSDPSELRSSLDAQLERAQRRLVDKRLLQTEDDAVSVLIPGRARMLFRARDDARGEELPLSGMGGIPGLHGRAYELRPDAGAIASASTATSAALSRSGTPVPVVFDEQARHLRATQPSTDPSGLAQALAAGSNAAVIEGRSLILGVTPNRMLFNAELFEKCARAYLLARGEPPVRQVHLVPFWVRWIAGRRLARDQANAARCHAAGREAPELTAY